METERPRLLRMHPVEATVIPLPTEETTPPVTKMYLGMRSTSSRGRGKPNNLDLRRQPRPCNGELCAKVRRICPKLATETVDDPWAGRPARSVEGHRQHVVGLQLADQLHGQGRGQPHPF